MPLVLTVNPNQEIKIGENIIIRINNKKKSGGSKNAVQRNKFAVSIDAPKEINICRPGQNEVINED